MLVELLVILALIALFFIYLLAQESNREKRVEKYGEAVNKFAHMVADEVGSFAQNITESAVQKSVRLAQEDLANRNGHLYRFKMYWDEEYLNDLLSIDDSFKNSLDILGVTAEIWDRLSRDLLYIGILRKESREIYDYSKKNTKYSRHCTMFERNPGGSNHNYKMIISALQHFNISAEEWVEYGDAVVEMYDLMEKDYIRKYGIICQIMPAENNLHLL